MKIYYIVMLIFKICESSYIEVESLLIAQLDYRYRKSEGVVSNVRL